jgi:hypothetical protein
MFDIIKFQDKDCPATYCGDGVYAIFDGWGIWLHANDHENPSDRIYLEPEVLKHLINFDREMKGAIMP